MASGCGTLDAANLTPVQRTGLQDGPRQEEGDAAEGRHGRTATRRTRRSRRMPTLRQAAGLALVVTPPIEQQTPSVGVRALRQEVRPFRCLQDRFDHGRDPRYWSRDSPAWKNREVRPGLKGVARGRNRRRGRAFHGRIPFARVAHLEARPEELKQQTIVLRAVDGQDGPGRARQRPRRPGFGFGVAARLRRRNVPGSELQTRRQAAKPAVRGPPGSVTTDASPRARPVKRKCPASAITRGELRTTCRIAASLIPAPAASARR